MRRVIVLLALLDFRCVFLVALLFEIFFSTALMVKEAASPMASVCNAAIYDPATSVTTFTSPLPGRANYR